MNKILPALLALTLPLTGFAAAKKATPTATPAPEQPAAATQTGQSKPMGFYARIEAIDTKANTFTQKNKDGREIKFVITERTQIKNGDAPAKLADIKPGDTVSGSRIKKSDTEYEVIKITKFGIPAPKAAKQPATPEPTKPAATSTPAPKAPKATPKPKKQAE